MAFEIMKKAYQQYTDTSPPPVASNSIQYAAIDFSKPEHISQPSGGEVGYSRGNSVVYTTSNSNEGPVPAYITADLHNHHSVVARGGNSQIVHPAVENSLYQPAHTTTTTSQPPPRFEVPQPVPPISSDRLNASGTVKSGCSRQAVLPNLNESSSSQQTVSSSDGETSNNKNLMAVVDKLVIG